MPPVGAGGDTRPASPQNIVSWALNFARDLLLSPRYFWYFTTLLFLGETALGLLIIWKIPYTKIDWPAYMQQVDGFLSGERDYSRLEGDTGPLVYPALHLYIYTALHKLLPASDRIRPAQYIFLVLYLTTFLLTAYIYRRSRLPQVCLVLLTLSKRAHSIYMLRLFNDPWGMMLLYASVACFMRGGKSAWRVGCVLFSLALGVKMNILLSVPGLLVLLFQYTGLLGTIEGITIIGLIQAALPAPFFFSPSEPHLLRSYLSSAFDFSRQFLYEWTVNWSFVPKETFHSKDFATSLLIGHLSVLILFAWFRWSPVPGGTWQVLVQGLQQPQTPPMQLSQQPAYHIPLVLFTSNLIGMTFARSLHYQFYSWYFHQLPMLLYLAAPTRFRLLGLGMWLVFEVPWSTSPATPVTSYTLLTGHLILLGGLWCNSSWPSQGATGPSGENLAPTKSQ